MCAGRSKDMKPKAKRQYAAPRVKATHPKERLQRAVRPHGPAVSYDQDDHIT